jgi:hypothetical protein
LEKKRRREGVIVCDWTLGPGWPNASDHLPLASACCGGRTGLYSAQRPGTGWQLRSWCAESVPRQRAIRPWPGDMIGRAHDTVHGMAQRWHWDRTLWWVRSYVTGRARSRKNLWGFFLYSTGRSGVVSSVIRALSSVSGSQACARDSRWRQRLVQTASATWWHTSDRTQDRSRPVMPADMFGQCDFYLVKG